MECRFLQIIDTIPNNENSSFAIDVPLSIIFSEEILQDSLTDKNFKLYTQDYQNQYVLDIEYGSKQNIVSLTPSVTLLPNTTYVLTVRGNTKQQLGKPTGVISSNGNTLLDTVCIFFTTAGVTQEVQQAQENTTVVTAYDNVTAADVIITDEITGVDVVAKTTIVNDPASLECIKDVCNTDGLPELKLISSFPENGEINVTDFTYFYLVFNDDINWENYGISILDSELSEEDYMTALNVLRQNLNKIFRVERHDIPFDCDAEWINIENNSYLGSANVTQLNSRSITITMDSEFLNQYHPNSEYTITIRGGSLRGINTAPIVTTKINFLTLLTPMYASLNQLGTRLPTQFDHISDYEKYKLIAEYSELLVMRYNGRTLTDKNLCYCANKFVLCGILNDLMNNYRDSLGGLKQRQQFGLNIVYNSIPVGVETSGPYDNCVDDSINCLDAQMGIHVAIGVKSGMTKWYFGRRRGIRSIWTNKVDQTVPEIFEYDELNLNIR